MLNLAELSLFDGSQTKKCPSIINLILTFKSTIDQIKFKHLQSLQLRLFVIFIDLALVTDDASASDGGANGTLAMVDGEGFERPRRTARPVPRLATLVGWPIKLEVEQPKAKQGNRFEVLAMDDTLVAAAAGSK